MKLEWLLGLFLLLGMGLTVYGDFVTLENSIDPGTLGQTGSAILEKSGGHDGINETLSAFTICVRFKFKTLGSPEFPQRGRIVTIGDW